MSPLAKEVCEIYIELCHFFPTTIIRCKFGKKLDGFGYLLNIFITEKDFLCIVITENHVSSTNQNIYVLLSTATVVLLSVLPLYNQYRQSGKTLS